MTFSELDKGLCTCLVQFGVNAFCGSGFLLRYKEHLYVITARHVIYIEDNEVGWKLYGNNVSFVFRSQQLPIESRISIDVDFERTKLYVSNNVDIVAVDVTDYIESREYVSTVGDVEFSPFDVCDDEYGSAFGKTVFQYGYPTALKFKGTFGLKPIMTKGIVCSYCEKDNKFVIDVPSIYGCSGSAVFLVDEHQQVRVLGVAQSIALFKMDWFNKYEDDVKKIDWNNSGLTICSSISSILKIIENGNPVP